MTEQHPITPPDELVEQWVAEYWSTRSWRSTQAFCSESNGSTAGCQRYILTKTSQWGYEQRGADLQKARDEELEACCEHLKRSMCPRATIDYLRAAMRPKPLSLSESALGLIDKIEYNAMTKNAGNEKAWDLKELEVVRRALKRLQKLERQGDGSGTRANGGRVPDGIPYIVGERGPEEGQQ